MSEHDEQKAVVQYLEYMHIPFYAIPNGGYRKPAEACKLKSEGVRAGVPDLCIPVAKCGVHSLYIEMKAKGGRLSAEQARWIRILREQGMAAFVCYGAESAIKLIKDYMRDAL